MPSQTPNSSGSSADAAGADSDQSEQLVRNAGLGGAELARCQDVLRQMEEEIALLRNASLTFGELADRLNREVQLLRAELRRRDESGTEEPPDPTRRSAS